LLAEDGLQYMKIRRITAIAFATAIIVAVIRNELHGLILRFIDTMIPHEFVRDITTHASRASFMAFTGGALASFALAKCLRISRFSNFIHVLEHELVHGIAAIVCGARFTLMTVSMYGGAAEVSKSNIFIRLAPYFIPLFSIITLLISYLVAPNFRIFVIVMGGILYGNFVRGAFSFLGIQPDIKKSGGRLISYPILLCANLLMILFVGCLLLKIRA
jgi:hypothetical protein